MPRTTVNIDAPILRELKRLQRREGKTLGRLLSELLAQALRQHGHEQPGGPPPFRWISRPMAARIDLADKDALYALLEPDDRGRPPEPGR